MKNYEIINIINALNEIGNKRLPAKVGFAIAKNQMELERIYKTYNAQREKLVDSYAQKDEEGNRVTAESPDQIMLTDPKAFAKELQELLEADNEIGIHKIDFSELEYGEKYDLLTVAEIKALEFMVKE